MKDDGHMNMRETAFHSMYPDPISCGKTDLGWVAEETEEFLWYTQGGTGDE